MNKYSKGINGIRGLMAIIIALFHFELIFPMTEKGIFKSGYVAVEFFFILSGFLLVKGFYDKDKCDIFAIIKSKVKKMYPAYIAALILLVTIYVSKWYNFNYIAWLKEGVNASHFMAEAFMLQGLGVSNFEWVNSPGWYTSTLLICSVIVLVLLKKFNKKYSKVMSIIISLGIYTFYFITDYSMSPTYFVYSLFSSAILRGLAGMSLGAFTYEMTLLCKDKIKNMNGVIYNIIEIALFGLLMGLALFREPSRLNYLFFLPSVLLIGLMFLREGILDKILSFKVFAFLGTVSYEFYIFQSPISNLVNCYFNEISQPYVTIVYFMFNLIIAIIFYYLNIKVFNPKRKIDAKV